MLQERNSMIHYNYQVWSLILISKYNEDRDREKYFQPLGIWKLKGKELSITGFIK